MIEDEKAILLFKCESSTIISSCQMIHDKSMRWKYWFHFVDIEKNFFKDLKITYFD